ncbi:ATP-binding protein [Ideonella sp.]|uniref:ATP-binding protein n=1 Tax=Ideonella sp. TaxID=1929293 RepID=UPI002B48F9CE|nr:AAA family ATPase [Ideonella sp.]HJV70330.1 AAA family ATPase [Ideonella sp.]
MQVTREPTEIAGIGRRRYLTVLFTDLSGSTQLGDLLQAEHYAAMLGALRALCRDIVPRHGGRIARLQGDGMLAIFGYPDPHEDDGRRAIEAALDLHQAIGRVAVDGSVVRAGTLGLHSGVHAGLVFVSDGDVERGRFELLGSVPNIAFRLADVARRGEIVVSEETLGPQMHFFSLGEREWITPRGRKQALPAYRILGRAALQRRYEARRQRGLAPFVGRQSELSALLAALRGAAGGRPACVAVCGGPGVGKTRLIEEFVRQPELQGWRVLMGHCESYLGAEPLQPFLQMLRGLLGLPLASPGSALPASPVLDALGALGDEGRAARDALARAVPLVQPGTGRLAPAGGGAMTILRDAFDACAALQPLLLVLDDWQWADEASQHTLDALRSLGRPLLVLLAVRSGGDTVLDAGTTALALSPLALPEAQAAMRHLLPRADPFLVAQIHQHAGGNPLFIEELCHIAHDAAERHAPEPSPGGAAWLSALIASRVARLSADQLGLVQAAAVIGNAFPAWLLERLCSIEAGGPQIMRLAELDLIFPAEQPGWLRFKHGVTRDVVYEGIALEQRTALHRRVAEALAPAAGKTPPEEFVETLAYHCGAGALHEDAARYAEWAGDKAAAAAALDRARSQYTAALQALDALEPHTDAQCLRWCAVAEKLGMACVFDPLALGDGLGLFERGLALARAGGSVPAIARAEYWMGYLLYARGIARPSRVHCEASLALAAELGDERLAAQVRATLGQVLHAAGDYARALPLLDSAIDSKRRQRRPGSSVAVGSAYALACKGALLGDQGRFDLADECFAEAMELLGDTPHQVASSVRNWISCCWQWQGRWEEAAAMAETSVGVAERVRSRQLLAMSRALRGHARWVLHGRDDDLQAMRDSIAWIEERRGGLVTSLNYGHLVDACASRGLQAEARRHAARLLLRARQRDHLGQAEGCRALARITGEPARADRWLAQADRAADARGAAHEHAKTALCRAELARAQDRPADAAAWLDRAAAGFERLGMAWHLAQARALRGS